jgi:hypothetical protein
MESQCLGLAEALGLEPIIKRVKLRSPWKQLSPYLRIGNGFAYSAKGDAVAPPWPDLLIATGRQSVAASLYVRDMSARAGRRTLTVQVQDPVIATSNFDLVITPQHDQLRGMNVVQTLGAMHRVTAEKLRAEAESFAPRVAHLKRPYIGVLIGGPNGAYSFGEADMRKLAAALVSAARERGASLLVTPSRRTGEANLKILAEALKDVPSFIWDGAGANPYYGMLGAADEIVVTCDSVNMVSEAMATKKLVHVFDLPGGSDKFSRFHMMLRERGLAHGFTGKLEPHHQMPPGDDMERAVAAVRAAYAKAVETGAIQG